MALTDETQATALSLVKARLNRMPSDTTLDVYLIARIRAAAEALEKTGIHLLPESVDDTILLTDMTVWQYQNRDASGAMPEWLRLRRRERWLREPQPIVEDTLAAESGEVIV